MTHADTCLDLLQSRDDCCQRLMTHPHQKRRCANIYKKVTISRTFCNQNRKRNARTKKIKKEMRSHKYERAKVGKEVFDQKNSGGKYIISESID